MLSKTKSEIYKKYIDVHNTQVTNTILKIEDIIKINPNR